MTSSTDDADGVETVLFAHALDQDEVGFGVDLAVRALPDGRYQLEWTDRVANRWTENYDSLAVTLARVAVLVRSVTTDRFFRHQATDDRVWTAESGGDGPAAFVADAERFLTEQLDGD